MIQALQQGATYDEVAARFHVGRATVNRWLRRYRETGSVEPSPHGGGTPRQIDGERLDVLLRLVDKRPDATCEELREPLRKATGVAVSETTIARALRRANWTFKKNHSPRRSASGRTFSTSARSSRRSWPRRTLSG